MAEDNDCCHCVDIENSSAGKKFKAKRIIDDCLKEDGRKYYKVQWEETWTTEDSLKNCGDLLHQYSTTVKPQMELLAHTEVDDEASRVFVLKVRQPTVSIEKNNVSINGLDGHRLLDKLNELGSRPKVNADSVQEDVKMITYAQLQKAGFLVDEEEAGEPDTSQASQASQQQFDYQQPVVDRVENAKLQMYTQVAGHNGIVENNLKYLHHYVHNDVEASRNRARNYVARRRQPFQLYKCEICGSEFVHRTHLKIHQRTHTGEKPYKCEICGRCFAQKGNLHVHIKIHTGEKDFVCEYCQRAFITHAQLFVHLRTHTNPNRKRPYATGRPSKNELRRKNISETPNQIIVQLVQQDSIRKEKQHDLQNTSNIPTLAVDEEELRNLTEENGAMTNLPSLTAQSSEYNMQTNLNSALTDHGRDMVHILVAQQ